MRKLILRLNRKCEVMIRPVIKFLNNLAYRINTRWAWFFTNGMKSPKEIPHLIEPDNFK